MFTKTPLEELMKLTKYDRIMISLYRNLLRNYTAQTFPDEIEFTQDDVRIAMRDAVQNGWIKREIKNVPDIKYTYDARRNLPIECEQLGPLTWLQNGKGKYKFRRTKRRNLIVLPDDLPFPTPQIEPEVDQTPPFIASLLGDDEQAVFTRVRNSGLISKFLGFSAWPIQGHHRTTVSYGQIEVDEVQAGLDGQTRAIVPISGKGGQDKLSWSQALNLNTYGAQKPRVDGLTIKSIGLWRDDENTIWMIEFTPSIDIDDIEFANVRRFRLITN
jgi:DNA-directed RNA polymerase subunit K/omega